VLKTVTLFYIHCAIYFRTVRFSSSFSSSIESKARLQAENALLYIVRAAATADAQLVLAASWVAFKAKTRLAFLWREIQKLQRFHWTVVYILLKTTLVATE
jgi:hypothetical protein